MEMEIEGKGRFRAGQSRAEQSRKQRSNIGPVVTAWSPYVGLTHFGLGPTETH